MSMKSVQERTRCSLRFYPDRTVPKSVPKISYRYGHKQQHLANIVITDIKSHLFARLMMCRFRTNLNSTDGTGSFPSAHNDHSHPGRFSGSLFFHNPCHDLCSARGCGFVPLDPCCNCGFSPDFFAAQQQRGGLWSCQRPRFSSPIQPQHRLACVGSLLVTSVRRCSWCSGC